MKISLTCILVAVLVGLLTLTGWTSQESISSSTAASSASASSVNSNSNTLDHEQQQQQQEVNLSEVSSSLDTLQGKPLTKREIFEEKRSISAGPATLLEAVGWIFTITLGVIVAILSFAGGYELKKKSRLWYPVVGLLYLVGTVGGLFGLLMFLAPFLADTGACWQVCNHFGPL